MKELASHKPAPPVIWTGCKVQIINESTGKFDTIAQCIYTPRAINDAMKQHGLTTCWVRWTCGREMWRAGNQIATRE